MKEPIRVAQVIGKWVGGGVEATVMNYYRNIDKNKIQYDFLCDNDSTDIPYEEIESLGGKVILIPPYQKVFEYQKEVIRILKEGNYKIIHSHINTLSVFPLRAAKKAGVPVRIAHNHSTTNKAEWKKNLMKQALKPFAKTYSTDYMCCTEHAGRWLFGDKEFDNGNVYVLNNAIDLTAFKYDEKVRKTKRKELKINDDTLVFGHIGRFMLQKNHSFLIDIFYEIYKKNENVLLLLAGQGPLIDEIKEKVEKLGLINNVQFLGQRKDVHELYQTFDIFLFPSLYEGLGMVAVEAQVAGCPCLCSTEVPIIAKVIDKCEFISLEELANVWADKALSMINLKERKDGVKEAIQRGYDIKTEVKKLEEKYMELQGE